MPFLLLPFALSHDRKLYMFTFQFIIVPLRKGNKISCRQLDGVVKRTTPVRGSCVMSERGRVMNGSTLDSLWNLEVTPRPLSSHTVSSTEITVDGSRPVRRTFKICSDSTYKCWQPILPLITSLNFASFPHDGGGFLPTPLFLPDLPYALIP